MSLDKQIRNLARSSYWQEIYNASKTCSGINLFENTSNFSGIQRLLLYYSRVYDMVYTELYQMEWENLSEEVIKDDDRLDAFLYYRRKEQEKRIRKYNEDMKKNNRKNNKGTHFKVFSGPKNKKTGDK
jgi:hypothetical protein